MNTPPSSSTAQTVMRVLLGSAALALAFIGQLALRATPDGLGLGLTLLAIAVVLFALNSASPWLAQRLSKLVPPVLSYRGILIGLALALTVTSAATQVVFERTLQANYSPVLVSWLAAIMFYLAALWAGKEWRFNWTVWWQTHRAEALAVGLVTLLGAVLRFSALGSIPRVINGDEGLLGQAATLTRQLPLANPFALFENFGALYLQGVQLMFEWFGQTAFALRLLPAAGGTLAVPALYLMTRQMFGLRPALFAGVLLALSHAHIHFSRTVAVGYIQGTLLIPLELYFLLSGLQKRSAARLGLSGLILGVHFNVYLSAQIIAPLLVVYLLIAAVVCRPLVQNALRAVPAFFGGLVIAGLPYAVQAWLKPTEFLARMNADGTFQTGWLTQRAAETGQGTVQILTERAAHAFLSLNYYPALDFYGSQIPLLDFVTSVLFILGLGYALWRTREAPYLLLNGYFWAVTLAVGVFSVPPSADSYRMLMALPAAVTLAALGLEHILTTVFPAEVHYALGRRALTGIVLGGLLMINIRAYFYDFAGECRYGGDPQTRFASYLGNHLRQYSRATTVYLLSDDVFRYGTHSSVDFLSQKRSVTNWDAPMSELSPGPDTVIIASPNRIAELQEWSRTQASGDFVLETDCQNLMLLAFQN